MSILFYCFQEICYRCKFIFQELVKLLNQSVRMALLCPRLVIWSLYFKTGIVRVSTNIHSCIEFGTAQKSYLSSSDP